MLENKIIFDVAIILLGGLVFGRLGKFIKLPNVTGYLIAGLLLGPSFLDLIPPDMVNGFTVVSDIALAFIAFSVGSEFRLSYFKKVGITPVVIAICESFGAIIVVTGCLLILRFDTKLSIMLGAIAAATAPAQTIMVINQYKAKGSLTSMLVSVVAIDDAVALIGFGIATTIVKMMSSTASQHLIMSILSPVYEILISLALGAVLSIFMLLFFRWFKKPSNRLCITVAFVMAVFWLSVKTNGSSLLACMALGAVLVNVFDDIDSVLKISDAFTPPILMTFFVISGAGFNVYALSGIGVIGLIYVIARVAGKFLGAWTGGKIMKAEDKVCKYLGPTLMPQAGVALGLLMVAGKVIPEYASQIRVVILCSTFIYSIIGPIVAKIALVKSGEIALPENKKSCITKLKYKTKES